MKPINRNIAALVVVILYLSHPILAHAYESVYEKQSNPSFRAAFAFLEEKRTIYNELNDSLFLEDNEEAWSSFTYRRSSTNYDNYIENQHKLDDIIYYFLEQKKGFDASSGKLSPRTTIPIVAYDSLWAAINEYDRLIDPFLTEIFIGNILIPHYENLDSISEKHHILLSHLYLNYADAVYQIFAMCDESSIHQCYDALNKCIAHSQTCISDKEASTYWFYAMTFFFSHPSLITAAERNGQEIDSLLPQFRDYYFDHLDTLQKHHLWDYYHTMIMMAMNYEVFTLRNLILYPADSLKASNNDKIDSLIAKLRSDSFYEDFKENIYPSEYFSKDMLMMVQEGKLTPNEAFEKCKKQYTSFLPFNSISAFNRSFTSYVFTSQDMLYIIDKADYPYEYKCEFAQKVIDQALELVSRRPKKSIDSRHSALFMRLLKDERLLKYIPEGNRIPILKESTRVFSIHTLVHIELVEEYAVIILDALLDQSPEQLIGILGTKSVDDVLTRKEEIKTILRIGCQFHDAGKLQIESIVNNEFRKLTDHEFRLIKTHSSNATFLLDLDSKYGKFSAFALGHHKWYDGTRGYPDWYDNTACEESTLVDILTIADCLEAATNFMSRNYRRSKSFETLVQEFKNQSGTRYNPYIVNAIVNSKGHYRRLSERIKFSRFAIYNKLFRNTKKK